MGALEKAKISYPDALAALGRYIAKKGLTDVCLMEFESGFIVLGSVLYETGESYGRRMEMQTFSFDELQRLIREV